MKKSSSVGRFFTIVFVAVAFLFGTNAIANAEGERFFKNPTPVNEGAIIQKLINEGLLDKNASQEEIMTALKKYLSKKLPKSDMKKGVGVDKEIVLKKLKTRKVSGIKKSNLLQNRKMGKKPFEIEGVEEQEWDGEVRETKMLILLAQFGDDEYDLGPLHNSITRPGDEDNTSLWVEDFGTEHYAGMLFTKGGYDAIDHRGKTIHLDSMVDYYMEQSGGSYDVKGDVYGWFTLPHSEAYYGDDDPEGGHDNLQPGGSKDLVADLLKVAYESGTVPFEEYDHEDPGDLDGDGVFDEPDGIIDHLVIVHAGVDQSGGGGAQGDNAMWAHSSSVFEFIPSDNPTVPYWDGNMVAENYIIQGEDGSIGVFCHEFAHDIGLPDEYDTIYSGDGDAVGFYSLMSSGSWVGKPLGTKPAPISPWGRIVLGNIWGGQWIQPTEIDITDLRKKGTRYNIDQTVSVGLNNQVLKVNLPEQKVDVLEPYEGSFELYGGKADEIDHKTVTSVSLPDASDISLDFWTWYTIEENWDFGFIQISTDNGETWTSLSTSRTVDTIVADGHPDIKVNMPGYTGNSEGWVNEIVDISQYAGMDVLFQFRYMTDWGTNLTGFFVDAVKVVADDTVIFEDGLEDGDGNWTIDGWVMFEGFEYKGHYYLSEWRNHVKSDEALEFCYNYLDYDKGIADFFNMEPGMLLWYRNNAYTDNWVGEHPGYGFLGIVDSHPGPMAIKNTVLRTRLQIHDATFGLHKTTGTVLTIDGNTKYFRSKKAVRKFKDSRSYFNENAPSSGLILPNYGVYFRVVKESDDHTVGKVVVGRR